MKDYNRRHDARMRWDHEPGDGWAGLGLRLLIVATLVGGLAWHAGWFRG